MIRNYQKTSSDSAVDLSPIYNSLQTINALLYRLDVQTTIPNAINSISNSVINIGNKVDNITKDDYSLAYYITDPVLSKPLYQYNNYSTFQTTAPIVIIEPYVQSITRTSDLEGRYYFCYDLKNCTLEFTNESLPSNATNRIEYEGLTCAKIEADYFGGSSYNIGTYSLNGALLTRCSGQYLEASYCKLYDCDIHQMKINATTRYASISNCILKNVSVTNVELDYCLGIYITGLSNRFFGCTLASYPTISNTFREMNLNNVGNMKHCEFDSVGLNCTKNARPGYYSFEHCTFYNASIYHLTHTNFINCSGNVYIPKFINASNLFDNNNNYIGDYVNTMSLTSSNTYTETSSYSFTFDSTVWFSTTLTEYEPSYISTTIDTTYSYSETSTSLTWNDPDSRITSTFTTSFSYTDFTITDTMVLDTYRTTRTEFDLGESYTLPYTTYHVSTITEQIMSSSSYIREVSTTDTNTLTSDYSTTTEYTPQLTVNILPEWLTPNIFTNNGISSKYMNTYVNLNNYTISSPGFTANNVTGNIEMYISSITTNYIIANNDLYKFKLNVNNLNGPFIFSANSIKDGDILIDSFVNPTIAFSVNRFDKLNLYYNYTQNQSMVLENNEFNVLNIQAGAKGNIRMSSCTINNGVLYGWNGLYYCSANYIENYGENSYSKNSINTLRAHNIKLMYDNTISKLIIEPNDYDNLSFYGNSIGTIICPSYYNISASAIYNTFGTIIPY